ncbi:MAG TPA: MarC family protein, partial [Candidatus Bathyarchaeota archaeon]|nr:MarC family protein [Candidatus Bathyarchaeota archaeon]
LLSMKILLGGSLEKEVKRDESVGAVPIACPLLVGPGAITATILLLETEGILVTVLAAGANFAIIFLTMRNIDRVYRILGRTGTEVIAKVMALLLAAIAVEFISDGIKAWISRL